MTHAIVTCSEYFTDFALHELRRQHPDLVLVDHLSPCHLLVTAPRRYSALTRPWQTQLPIYLHHFAPVHRTLPLSGTPADLIALRENVQSLTRRACALQVRVVEGYRYSPISIAQAIRPGTPLPLPESPSGRVLSVLLTESRALIGISWASENLSPVPPGLARGSELVPNRAGRKLLEALDTFQIRLRPGDQALDLGAAPGAWTEVLRRRGLRVTAVAPRPLYDWLAVDPGVQFHPATAEEYLPRCQTVYDLIVNDMKLDAQDSARLMVAYAAHLRPQGIAVMTLKLRQHNTQRVMDHAYRLLRRAYKIIRVRQLVSNRHEVTLFLRRK